MAEARAPRPPLPFAIAIRAGRDARGPGRPHRTLSGVKHWSVVMNNGLAIALTYWPWPWDPGSRNFTSAHAAGRGAGAGGVPTLDVTRSCRDTTFPDCPTKEQIARYMLVKQMAGFHRAGEVDMCAGSQAGRPPELHRLADLPSDQSIEHPEIRRGRTKRLRLTRWAATAGERRQPLTTPAGVPGIIGSARRRTDAVPFRSGR